MFDRRGCGLSDPPPGGGAPTLEEQMDDLVAVMDAVGSEQAAVVAMLEAGAMAALFAATHPERTGALVLFEAQPRMTLGARLRLGDDAARSASSTSRCCARTGVRARGC